MALHEDGMCPNEYPFVLLSKEGAYTGLIRFQKYEEWPTVLALMRFDGRTPKIIWEWDGKDWGPSPKGAWPWETVDAGD